MNYNFSKFEEILSGIRHKATKAGLNDLKKELNNFFSDSKCLEVLYTHNTDKMFFGMSVIPNLGFNYIGALVANQPRRFDQYYLELDSRLFSPLLGLTDKELTAILLHEVGHLVNNASASINLSNIINVKIDQDGVSIDRAKASKESKLINLGIIKALRKTTSIFHKNDEEYIADAFVVDCGYGQPLERAYHKIINDKELINNKESNDYKISTLLWTLQVYTSMGMRRRAVLKRLKEGEEMESSVLMIRLYKDAYEKIKSNTYVLEESGYLLIEEKFIDKLKYASISQYENEIYEFDIRIKHLEDEDEAMDTLRDLNFRISLLDDYIATQTKSSNDVKKYTELANKYRFLRTTLVKLPKFKSKSYGLYVKYPEMDAYSTRI